MTYGSLLQHLQTPVWAPLVLTANLLPLILHQWLCYPHLKFQLLCHQGHQRHLHQLLLWDSQTHDLCHRSRKMGTATRSVRWASWNRLTNSQLWRCRPDPRQIISAQRGQMSKDTFGCWAQLRSIQEEGVCSSQEAEHYWQHELTIWDKKLKLAQLQTGASSSLTLHPQTWMGLTVQARYLDSCMVPILQALLSGLHLLLDSMEDNHGWGGQGNINYGGLMGNGWWFTNP